MSAHDLKGLGLVDEVISEPMGGAHQNADEACKSVKKALVRNLRSLQKIPAKELLEERYQKYRRIGEFSE